MTDEIELAGAVVIRLARRRSGPAGGWLVERADRFDAREHRVRTIGGVGREAPIEQRHERFGHRGWAGSSSGNHAFDEYRAETLQRLEEEQREFREFLQRLRAAKDKAEFDQFMADRRNRPASPPQESPPQL